MKADAKNNQNKREDKKRVNIKWNSRLFFQIGIIVSCLFVFFIMQVSFEMKSLEYGKQTTFGIEEPPMITYVIDVDKPKVITSTAKTPVKPVSAPKLVKTNSFTVTDNKSTEVETLISPTDTPLIEPSNSNVAATDPEPSNSEPKGPSSILNVEFVPVYPGCESLGSNAEKIDCLSSEINIFVNRNFRKELLENLERNQTQKIYVQFKIDSKGFITDVRANSQNETLKKEAIRVIAKLPKMKPGRQGDKFVDVIYTIPIIFKIQ